MQDTETLELPVSKKQVIVKGYVTGLIDQEVSKIIAGANKTKFEAPVDQLSDPDNVDANSFPPGTKVTFETDPTAQLNADQKLLELMLVAVDGNNGANLLEQLLALPKADVDFVKSKVKELQKAGEVKASDPKAPVS